MTKFLRGSGRIAIDFALTGPIGGRPKLRERLDEPADLDAWLESVGHAPVTAVSSRQLAEALRVRDAIASAVDAVIGGSEVSQDAIERLNHASRRGAAVPILLPDGTGAMENQTVASALASVAQDTIRLIGTAGERWRLRECDNPECPRIFFDHSPPGRRRWCAGTRCGDVARARAYRQRRRTAAT